MLLYLTACLPFVSFINSLEGQVVAGEDLAFFAGEYAIDLEDSQLRPFHASFQYFWPFIDKSRITCELKGLEKTANKVPTTPITYSLTTSMARWLWKRYGLGPAVGVLVAFGGLLRTKEILCVKKCDIIWRGDHVVQTTIRLGITKNNREQVCMLEPNSIAEPALKFWCNSDQCPEFTPIFNIDSYSILHRYVREFKEIFNINLKFTPHSFRAGGATNLRLRGFTHHQIQDMGRWQSENTAKSYIDVVFNMLPETIQIQDRVTPNGLAAIMDILSDPF